VKKRMMEMSSSATTLMIKIISKIKDRRKQKPNMR
jgi:hypothetical protein